jgi:ribosomal protein L25 (general stress protein Ctc)
LTGYFGSKNNVVAIFLDDNQFNKYLRNIATIVTKIQNAEEDIPTIVTKLQNAEED